MREANAGRDAAVAAARSCASGGARVAVLVEGMSDRAAVLTVASRSGQDLDAAGVAVVPMGGATNIGHFASALGPPGLGLRLAGLCDAGEEKDFRRGLRQGGLEPGDDRAGLERLGFYVCVADLEDELIRALGGAAVEAVIEEQGELPSLRRFQNMPAQRGRAPDRLLRRFIGTRSGRKLRYGMALAAALDLGNVPRPVGQLIASLPRLSGLAGDPAGPQQPLAQGRGGALELSRAEDPVRHREHGQLPSVPVRLVRRRPQAGPALFSRFQARQAPGHPSCRLLDGGVDHDVDRMGPALGQVLLENAQRVEVRRRRERLRQELGRDDTVRAQHPPRLPGM